MLDTRVLPTILLDRNVFRQELAPREMEHRAPNGLAHLLNADVRTSNPVEKEVNNCPLLVYEENGRWYHAYRPGIYPFPCDAPERDRQDMTHHLIYGILLNHYNPQAPTIYDNGEVRPNVLAAPIAPIIPARVLDLGCGSGLWTCDTASRFPQALIEGADLAGGQPDSFPNDGTPAAEIRWRTPNSGDENVFDFDQPQWHIPQQFYDLIHASQLCGSISNWRSFLQNCYGTLRPGGWLESIEIDFRPCCDDNTLPNASALSAWWWHMTEATANKPIEYPTNLPIFFREQGFVDVQCITLPLPVSPWFYNMQNSSAWVEQKKGETFAHTGCQRLWLPQANWRKNIIDASDWLQMMLTNDPSFQGCEVFNGLSMAPFVKRSGWSKESVKNLVPKLMSCVSDRSYHTYFQLHIVIGRKPDRG